MIELDGPVIGPTPSDLKKQLTPEQESAFEAAINDFHCIVSEGGGCLMLRGSRKIFEAGIISALPNEIIDDTRQLAFIIRRMSKGFSAGERLRNFTVRDLQLIDKWSPKL